MWFLVLMNCLVYIFIDIFGIQVVIELLLGLVLCMWAALTVPGNFLSIHPDSEDNRCASFVSWDEFFDAIWLSTREKILQQF